MNRAELEVACIEAGLADTKEQSEKILASTDAEIVEMLTAWILAGDECGVC